MRFVFWSAHWGIVVMRTGGMRMKSQINCLHGSSSPWPQMRLMKFFGRQWSPVWQEYMCWTLQQTVVRWTGPSKDGSGERNASGERFHSSVSLSLSFSLSLPVVCACVVEPRFVMRWKRKTENIAALNSHKHTWFSGRFLVNTTPESNLYLAWVVLFVTFREAKRFIFGILFWWGCWSLGRRKVLSGREWYEFSVTLFAHARLLRFEQLTGVQQSHLLRSGRTRKHPLPIFPVFRCGAKTRCLQKIGPILGRPTCQSRDGSLDFFPLHTPDVEKEKRQLRLRTFMLLQPKFSFCF